MLGCDDGSELPDGCDEGSLLGLDEGSELLDGCDDGLVLGCDDGSELLDGTDEGSLLGCDVGWVTILTVAVMMALKSEHNQDGLLLVGQPFIIFSLTPK